MVVALLCINGIGKVHAQGKEIADGTNVDKINFSRNCPPVDAIAANGVAGTGRNEVAVIGQHASGDRRLPIKDLPTGDNFTTILIPLNGDHQHQA